VQARTLIIPDVFPTRRIRVESEQIKGFYVVEHCQFSGSTFGDDFYCDLDAVQL
jgi:hypothetical protein